MADLEAAGVSVYALSYDEGDALQDFARAHGITYALLSDPDSEVIRSFGILNTFIAEDDHPWYGIPFPGTYVVAADGTITHKFFDGNLAVRAGPEQLLRAVRGEALLESETAAPTRETVEVSVALDGTSLATGVQKDLVVRFRVPEGRHVYAEPAPEGTVAVDVTLDENPRLVQRPLVRPPSEAHALAGSGETFPVHHDRFELRLPLTVNNATGDVLSEVTVAGEIRWQSCDDEICDIPTRHRFELTLPISEPPAVALGSKKGAALEPNALAHFVRMSERRRRD